MMVFGGPCIYKSSSSPTAEVFKRPFPSCLWRQSPWLSPEDSAQAQGSFMLAKSMQIPYGSSAHGKIIATVIFSMTGL